MMINRLPTEIMNMIFLYLENPEAKLIKNEMKYYEKDHNWLGTKQTGFYLVKSYMTFSEYYFDVKNDLYAYDSYYSRKNNNFDENYE
jgi:hypothetical protein